jgi:hypothetical protein
MTGRASFALFATAFRPLALAGLIPAEPRRITPSG